MISEADGYQPHLVAPEMGYRRLLQECLILFKVRGRSTVDIHVLHDLPQLLIFSLVPGR